MQNDSFRPSVRSRIKDALFIFLLLMAVMLFFALLTYEPADSNYWDTAPERVHNAIGPVGAHVSEVLLSYFGICAYILPILIVGLGYFMFLKAGSRRWYEVDYDLLSLKIIGLNVLLISSCTLVSACIYNGSFSSKGGGHLGAITLSLLRDLFGYNGTVLFMLALFVVGMTLFFGLSLTTVCSFIGGGVIWCASKLYSLMFRRKVQEIGAPNFKQTVNDATTSSSKVENNTSSTNASVSNSNLHQVKVNDKLTTSSLENKEQPLKQSQAKEESAHSVYGVNTKSEVSPNQAPLSDSVVSSPYTTNVPSNAMPKKEERSSNNTKVWGNEANESKANNEPFKPAIESRYVNAAASAMSSYISTNTPAPSSIAMPGSVGLENKQELSTPNNNNNEVTENATVSKEDPMVKSPYASTVVFSNNTRVLSNDDANLSIPGLSVKDDNIEDKSQINDNKTSKAQVEVAEPNINMETVDKVVADDDEVSPYMSVALFGGDKQSENNTKLPVSSTSKYPATNVLPPRKSQEEFAVKVNHEAVEQIARAKAQASQEELSRNAYVTSPLPGFAQVPSLVAVGVNTAEGITPVKPSFYTPNAFIPAESATSAEPSISVIDGGRIEGNSNVIDFAAIHPQSNESSNNNFTHVAESIERGIHEGQSNLDGVPNMFVAGQSQAVITNSNTMSDLPVGTTASASNQDADSHHGTGMRYVDFSADMPDSLNYHKGQYVHDGSELSTFPSLEIFEPPVAQAKVPIEELEAMCNSIDECMKHFGIKAHVACDSFGRKLFECGPVITRYMLELDSGKSSKIVNMQSDIARTLCVAKVRVIEVIPGVPYVGIEIPNKVRQNINVRELLGGSEFTNSKARLPICLGRDITGAPVIYDLAAAPHLMVAGTTGSGKSVGINTMLVSMLMKNTPEELRLILIDPKMLEFKPYHDIPHLLTPVITDMKESVSALRWSVQEMERRYKLLAHFRVRNIDGFNEIIRNAKKENVIYKDPFWHPNDSMDMEAPGLDIMPYIVFVIDEFADLILGMKKESGDIEGMISRLAAKARACGIHLILATQSPRAEVIRGSIRANFPSQIAFKVKSAMESRIIIDECGAENLLGRGDMLIKFNDGTGATRRAHGGYLSDDEISRFTDAWRMRGKPNYVEEVTKVELTEETAIPGEYVPSSNTTDALYDDVVEFVRSLKFKNRQFSVSLVQQHFNIGYNRASRLAQQLQDNGVVSEPMGASKTRSILIDM